MEIIIILILILKQIIVVLKALSRNSLYFTLLNLFNFQCFSLIQNKQHLIAYFI